MGFSMRLGVLDAFPGALIVRAGPLFCAHDPDNFATRTLLALCAGQAPPVAKEQIVSPTYLPDLADGALDLLIDGEAGIWHLANRGAVTWSDFAARLDRGLRGDSPAPASSTSAAASLKNTSLASKRGVFLPSFEDALDRFLQARSSFTTPATVRAPQLLRSF
jgi:dTDP-4-dehydrorhamnose reductase